MSTEQRDPIHESFDRLAALADDHVVGDRVPAIHRRVQRNRQRRAAATGVLATAAVVAGLAVWQALPDGDSRSVGVTDRGEETGQTDGGSPDGDDRGTGAPGAIGQQTTVDAEGVGADHVQLTFTVEGTSTTYTDDGTGGSADYAGPFGTELVVDGELVAGTDGGAMSCRAGGAPRSYADTFPGPTEAPYLVPVSGAGEHTIVVKAPYCDDGELVPDTTRVTVTTDDDDLVTADEQTADVDGDGEPDDVTLLSAPPERGGDEVVVVVDWAYGGAARLGVPVVAEAGLQDPVDLDGDGSEELVVLSSGGEYGHYDLVTERGGRLAPVSVVDAADDGAELTTTTDRSAWEPTFTADGLVSFRYVDPDVPDVPADVEVRRWTLQGTTLTLATATSPGCWQRVGERLEVTDGAC